MADRLGSFHRRELLFGVTPLRVLRERHLVQGMQPLDARFHRVGQTVIGGLEACEQGIAAARRQDFGIKG